MVPLYETSVPVYIRSLENLLDSLKVGEKWADENGVPPSKLIEASLAPDMKPLPFQIQSGCNTAKAVLPRLAGLNNVSMEDSETTFEQLYGRINKTIEILKTAKPENFAGKEDSEVSMWDGKIKYTGISYLQNFGLPNFFFHVTAAYAILRNQGAPVGKRDYLGLHV